MSATTDTPDDVEWNKDFEDISMFTIKLERIIEFSTRRSGDNQ